MSSLISAFQQTLHSNSFGVVGLSFLGGIVSSFLPCTIAMLPLMVGYIGGYNSNSKWDVFLQVSLFILGVALVMTILGVAASMLGVTFGGLIGSGWYYVIGIVAIIMGLQLLEVIHIPLPQFVTKMPETKSGKILTPFILGITFGTASSPCGTPFLAGILGLISQQGNILLGGLSLFFYALGQGMLLMVVGLFTGLLKHMATLRQVGAFMSKLSAYVFLLFGIGLIAQGAGLLGDILLYFHLI
jgi:cytochrome c-type biogenesis protein